MKPNRKKYNVKRSYSPYNSHQNRQPNGQTQSYQQQNHQYYSITPNNNTPIVMPYGPQLAPGFFNNGNNDWSIHPSVPLSGPSYGQQAAYQFVQRNNNPQMNPLHHSIASSTTQFSVPPPPYQFNGPVNYQQISNKNLAQANMQVSAPKRKWVREDAIRALEIEEELCKRNTSAPYLVIRFPDPPLDSEMVKGFSEQIDAVHFQKNSAPRFCFVRLKENADPERVIEDISKIPFGSSHLSAELRFDPTKPPIATKPEQVDPYTLYVGNLSLSVSVEAIKRQFPGAQRYDLAFKSKIKPIRYAFIRFESLEKSIEAFKNGMNLQIDGRSLVLRFRRSKFNYPAENITSEKSGLNNKDTPMHSDLSDTNGSRMTNKLKQLQTHLSHDGKPLVKNEYLEEYIKEEQYDSEYSYEDECSSSFCGFTNDFGHSAIKVEIDNFEQTPNSNCSPSIPSASEECNNGIEQIVTRGAVCDTINKTSDVSSTMRAQNVDENVNLVKIKVIDPTNNAIESVKSISSIGSISKKKYIENLYEQLNTSKVFKKEVRSEFDDLDAMLKEIE